MEQSTSNPKRFSAIPIPRSSKLPLPGKLPLDTTSHPVRPASKIGYAPTNGFTRNPSQTEPTRNRGSVSTVRGKPVSRPTSVVPRTPQQRPSVSQSRNTAEPGRSMRTEGTRAVISTGLVLTEDDAAAFRDPRAALRGLYEAENGTGDSSGGSEDGTTSPSAGSMSPVKPPKKSRPSLSDRTIDSLSQIPASPMTDRRRSSFFVPQSPMTPQRPPSAIGGSTTGLNKLSYGSVRGATPARSASPFKVPDNSHTSSLRRNTASAMPHKGSISAPSPRSSTPRPISPIKRIQPAPAGKGKPVNVASRTTSTVRPASRTDTTRKPDATRMRPPSPVKRNVPPDSLPAKPTMDDLKSPTSKASSSAVLRQQIAQARAAARHTAQSKPSQGSPSTVAAEFDVVEDPFNQKPNDGKDDLRQRIDTARRDGRLNIAAMGLTQLPAEVLHMYDAEAMEASSIPWSESVDLVRLNAADNELAMLEDDAFPDSSLDYLAANDDCKGNQFGGLDNLDLHGNKLTRLPLGLRQLTRLTSLNLARNHLDNWAFDIITQIPTLRDLNLANNNLSQELPESISRLALLESIDLSSNRLVMLPTTLRDLARLRSLTISSNRLTSIPFDQLSALPRLTDLAVASNALTGALFASSVTSMPHLRTLDVSDNAIASINFSKSLSLPAIVRLDVSRNRLGMFPSVEEWICLTTLLADENALSELPKGMVSLKSRLRTVSLERNSLRDIDEGIGEMEALEVLALGGNPLRERRLLSMGLDGIKREMERRKQLAAEVMNASS